MCLLLCGQWESSTNQAKTFYIFIKFEECNTCYEYASIHGKMINDVVEAHKILKIAFKASSAAFPSLLTY